MNFMTAEIKNVYDLLRSSQSSLHLHEGNVFRPQLPVKRVSPTKLPVIEDGEFKALPNKTLNHSQPSNLSAASKPVAANQARAESQAQPRRGFFQHDFVKYPLIFITAFGFFYFFLNFGAFTSILMARLQKAEPQPQTQGQVLGVSTPDYEKWISGYFYQVNNFDKLSPNTDYDRDGLTNYQEFLLGTNPTKKDTDNDGYSDGQEILNGYNPLYSGKLTAKQQEIIKDWDLSDINNRISYNARLALSSSNPYENPLFDIPAGPAAPNSGPAINYDLNNAGELYIPKLNQKAPIIWSKSADDFTKDLERGIIHYPGTVYPGQAGLSYISGHSSNYIWSKSSYSHVFARLNELNPGDEFFVTVATTDGNKQTLRYVVSEKREFQPDDQRQFESSINDSIVALSTCWPIGSTAKRYVVFGLLTGV